MSKVLKSAPELERHVLNALRNCSACTSISAVTVSAVDDRPGTNWAVTHLQVPGGLVPQACRDICSATVDRLREQFDLVIEIEADEL
ncbi:MAG: hypothetical protein ACRECO_03385 [Xanthobacteraceae bacterium]